MRNRTAVTLVELLTVLAIVGVLASLLLPAVQAARESARRMQCFSQLRQIGIAISLHGDSRRALPRGTIGHSQAIPFREPLESGYYEPADPLYWGKVPHTSFLVQLLPYLEQNTVFQKLDARSVAPIQDGGLDDGFLGFANLLALSQRRPGVLACPTDASNRPAIIIWGSQPAVVLPDETDGFLYPFVEDAGLPEAAILNYAACAGAFSGGVNAPLHLATFVGMMSSGDERSWSFCTDGLSNTIMVGETIGSVYDGQREAGTSWVVGGLVRGRGAVPWMQAHDFFDVEVRCLGGPKRAYIAGFGSFHSTVPMLFADGAVRGVNRSIDTMTLYRLCGARDGQEPRER